MAWENFAIWRGRLPHWRADYVTYYVTFRHRRALTEGECVALLDHLLRQEGKRWDGLAICVLPEATELLVTMRDAPSGEPYELSDFVERAKTRAGREIIKRSGERFPPFYTESYDRIMRDADELGAYLRNLVESPVKSELAETPTDYPGLWLAPGSKE